MIKVGINGFGRIGRFVICAAPEQHHLQSHEMHYVGQAVYCA